MRASSTQLTSWPHFKFHQPFKVWPHWHKRFPNNSRNFQIFSVSGARRPNPCIWRSPLCRRTSSSWGLTGRPARACLARATPPRWRSPPPTGSWRTTGRSSSASSPPTSPPTSLSTRRSRRRTRGQLSTSGRTGERNANLEERGIASFSPPRPPSFDGLQGSCPRQRGSSVGSFDFPPESLLRRNMALVNKYKEKELPYQHLSNIGKAKISFLLLQMRLTLHWCVHPLSVVLCLGNEDRWTWTKNCFHFLVERTQLHNPQPKKQGVTCAS